MISHDYMTVSPVHFIFTISPKTIIVVNVICDYVLDDYGKQYLIFKYDCNFFDYYLVTTW